MSENPDQSSSFLDISNRTKTLQTKTNNFYWNILIVLEFLISCIVELLVKNWYNSFPVFKTTFMSSIFQSLIGSTLEYIKETKLFITHCFPADEPNFECPWWQCSKKTVAIRHYWSGLFGDSKQFFISSLSVLLEAKSLVPIVLVR